MTDTTTAPSTGLRYVVITPARNEAEYIRQTLESMVAQSRPPLRWVIVSDGSTDKTDDIVNEYRRGHDWIELVRLPEQRDRSFAAKVQGFNAGFARVKDLPYDLVASLDADISFDPEYFDFLLGKFAANPRLGVAGTPFVEGDRHYDYQFTNIEHVSGACQVFRRECFDEIGGYVPIKGGGIDWTAVTTARMKGWQTRTFTEKTCLHLRPMGTGSGSRLSTGFRHGQKDYYLGGHPLWQIFRGVHQMRRRPYLFGGVSIVAGYSWAFLRRVQRPVSPELMRFHRAEQMDRLKRFFGKVV
ncbi:MAG TPA: glycosyltransferase family 2 protein [Vicinamibacterales bacterium]|nr:glycosyltransferase family 2 protein [Vicinamibacterales bacterium]